MGELTTADYRTSRADVFHDDFGEMLSGDVKIASVRHPPYLKVIGEVDMELGLRPPPQLAEDWIREMTGTVSIPEAWKKIEYERRYKEFLSSDGATKTLTRLRTVLKHNDVALVCTCHAFPFCPRRIIYERIEEGEETLAERLMGLRE